MLGLAPGCDSKSKKPGGNRPDTIDGGGDQLTKLDAAQERRIAEMDKSAPLLNPGLADALLGLPKDHAERVVGLAYPKAVVAKNNPRVNLSFKVKGAGDLDSLDVRWSRIDKRLVGSVVFTYRNGVDVAKLGELVKAVAKPIEGEAERWAVEGGRLALSYFPSNMEGDTVVAFEPAELEGDPITDATSQGKSLEEWALKGRQRDKNLKAAAARTDDHASGRGPDREAADTGTGTAPGEPTAAPPTAPTPAGDPLDGLDDI